MAHPASAPLRDVAPGDAVGDFVLGPPIAEGRLGVLFAATRKRDELPCAVRIVPAELVSDSAAWERFVGVASGVWQHDRKHIAPVFGSGALEGGRYFVAYPLTEGRTLAQLLEEHPLEPAELLAMLRGVCRALEAAHEHGVFHGDLTPASVCISSDADGRMRAKVLELGAAELLEGRRTRSGPVARDGAAYPPFDVARDLRALGLLCFEALSGSAFDERSDDPPRVSDVRPELGPHFDEPVHSLLVAAEQPANAAEAHARLARAARDAGYDVAGAIPPAPRHSVEGAPPSRRSQAASAPDGGANAFGSAKLGPALLAAAALLLVAVLLKTGC